MGKVICFLNNSEIRCPFKTNYHSRISSNSRVSRVLSTHSQLTRVSSIVHTTVSFTISELVTNGQQYWLAAG